MCPKWQSGRLIYVEMLIGLRNFITKYASKNVILTVEDMSRRPVRCLIVVFSGFCLALLSPCWVTEGWLLCLSLGCGFCTVWHGLFCLPFDVIRRLCCSWHLCHALYLLWWRLEIVCTNEKYLLHFLCLYFMCQRIFFSYEGTVEPQ